MDKKITRTFSYILHLGITMIVPILLMLFLGKIINNWINSDYTILVCVILGILAGIRNCYMLLKEELKMQEKEAKSSEDK